MNKINEAERYSADGKVHDAQRLKELQALPLWRKIQITQARIIEWYQYYEGNVYISFSGGKDSTVLLDIARKIYPDIEAVFVDTGLEYPELREFVKSFNNVTWLYPEKYNRKIKQYERYTYKQVLKDYGYPIISKEVSRDISVARRKPNGKTADKFNPESDYCKKYGLQWCLNKWNFLKDSDIPISNQCCTIMKKHPLRKYNKKFCKYPIIGTMASESSLRKKEWINNGCNAFNTNNPSSQPMSFWTEQDVLEYIDTYKISYASVYGDIIKDEKDKYITTKLNRTGCVFCGFGCHLEKSPNRFERLKETHPKMWDYCTRPIEENGLGMGEVLDYIGVKWGKEENDGEIKSD